MIYKNEQILGSYLAGLWEGDGYVAIRKNRKPTFHIAFHISQQPLAQKLLNHITDKCNGSKVGSIELKKIDNTCRFNIYSTSGLIYLITLINGKLRTPKAYKIDFIIDWLNDKHNANIKKQPLCSLPLAEDAWFAGFIDADNCFYIELAKKTKITNRRIVCRFQLRQRMIYPKKAGVALPKDFNQSYENIFGLIASYLCVKLNIHKVKNPVITEQYSIDIVSIKSRKVLRAYLNRFPLLTSKFLDYTDWCLADDIIILKQHYLEEKIIEIGKLKSSMNSSRTYFSWSHLNAF